METQSNAPRPTLLRNDDGCCQQPMTNVTEPCCENEVVVQSKVRPISIEQLDYGYIVRVGCQNFAFETKHKLIDKLTEYLEDPKLVEKQWFSGTHSLLK